MRKYLRYLPKVLREKLIRSQLRVDDDEVGDLTVKVATTVDEHEQAGRLVHAAYLKRGIIEPQKSGVWVTAHGLMPWTVVFIAKRNDEVIGTMSLIIDSAVGLPMDKVYSSELEPLRAEGRRVAEVGALCVSSGSRRRGVALLLNKLMWKCASELLGVNSLVIAVHPDAACMYEAVLRFVTLGSVKTYPGLTSAAKAIALHLDLDSAEAVLARDFGHLGTDLRSPYYLYAVMSHPQLEIPTAQALRQSLDAVRVLSAEHLGNMRPECFAELDTPQRRVVRGVLPALRDHLRSLPIQVDVAADQARA